MVTQKGSEKMRRVGTGKLRQLNDNKILRMLIAYMEVSKKELAAYSELTVATVGTILNDFVKEGIVVETESLHSTKGRPTQRYKLNAAYFHTLCVYIRRVNERDWLTWCILDALSCPISEGETEVTGMEPEQMVRLIGKNATADPLIKVIGIGVPAVVSKDRIIESDIPSLVNVNFKEQLEAATQIMTIVKNDMNFSAYGRYAGMEQKQDICYMVFPLSTGPGCGSIINGRLIEGKNSIAGELLYLPFFGYLKQKNQKMVHTPRQIALTICSIASITNPSCIVLTGESIKAEELDEIKAICSEFVPDDFMPVLTYCEDYTKDYLAGIQKIAVEGFVDKLVFA